MSIKFIDYKHKPKRYEYQKLYEKSFVIYINLGDPVVFDFLVRHNLFECAFENIIDLINLNKEVTFVHSNTN